MAIISGASSGIGQAIGLKLIEEGFQLGLTGRSLSKLIGSFGAHSKESCHLHPGDISDISTSVGLVESTVAKFGKIDTLVVNAGIGFFGSFLDCSPELTSEIIQTNILGSINLVRAALPFLLMNTTSNIIFISSTAGSRGGANEAIYAATKHAQNGLAGSLDREFRNKGVKITVVAPGATRTNFASGLGRNKNGEGQEDFLDPITVANTVSFVLSLPHDARIPYLSILPMSQQS